MHLSRRRIMLEAFRWLQLLIRVPMPDADADLYLYAFSRPVTRFILQLAITSMRPRDIRLGKLPKISEPVTLAS